MVSATQDSLIFPKAPIPVTLPCGSFAHLVDMIHLATGINHRQGKVELPLAAYVPCVSQEIGVADPLAPGC